MTKKKIFTFFLVFILISACSFDNKSGIWSGEKKRVSQLEKEQKEVEIEKKREIINVYSSESVYSKEVSLKKKIKTSDPIKNLSWQVSSLNNQNYKGNLYLSGTENIFLKQKIGKNKFNKSKIISSPLFFKNNIVFSDNTGTIFNVNLNGKIIWKKNIYKKIYKKLYKSLVFTIYKNKIFVADNIGFVYSIDLRDGKIKWIKNHGIPMRSSIKVYKNKIFLTNQDNRIFCLNTDNGSKIWDVRSSPSFIKLQNFLSTAISQQGHLITINSSGDLIKVDTRNGKVLWALSTLESTLAHATDFFESSNIVISKDSIFLSSKSTFFSHDLNNGQMNWRQEVSSIGTPIVDEENIFAVTKNGYFVIMDRDTGEIISSTNILRVLKKSKQNTSIAGFIMGSGNIYSITSNGYLIVSSTISGKVDKIKKIGDPVISAPIINNGKLYILTKNSRILGFN